MEYDDLFSTGVMCFAGCVAQRYIVLQDLETWSVTYESVGLDRIIECHFQHFFYPADSQRFCEYRGFQVH